MKNRGTHSTVERVSNATEKRGMARSDRTQRFIITPPKSIPMAAEGRFMAPGQATHVFSHHGENFGFRAFDFCAILCSISLHDAITHL